MKNVLTLHFILLKWQRGRNTITGNATAVAEATNNRPPEWYRADDRDKSWRELTEWFSRDRMSFTGLEQQELLQDKIEMHLAYAELHKVKWEKLEGMEETKQLK